MQIKSVYFFPNGNTIVFNEKGEQVPFLQVAWIELWAQHAAANGYDPTEIEKVVLPNKKMATFFKVKEGYNWNIEALEI